MIPRRGAERHETEDSFVDNRSIYRRATEEDLDHTWFCLSS